MTVKELIEWAEENHMMDANIYVDGKEGYEKVAYAWESEKDGSSVMLETKKV